MCMHFEKSRTTSTLSAVSVCRCLLQLNLNQRQNKVLREYREIVFVKAECRCKFGPGMLGMFTESSTSVSFKRGLHTRVPCMMGYNRSSITPFCNCRDESLGN